MDNRASIQDRLPKETAIYHQRFSAQEKIAREETWRILCDSFFSRYVSKRDTVLDIGAGDCCFLRAISAARRIAVDLDPQAKEYSKYGIEVISAAATDFSSRIQGMVDVVLISNFLEHLSSKDQVFEVFDQVKQVLQPAGKLLILQPNIRYVKEAYWDYIDHRIALTEKSLVEALEVSGFVIEELIPRFLPYTAKSFLSRFSGLVGLYLRLPLLWRVFGKQTFVVAKRLR